jgi:hypothetical protein
MGPRLRNIFADDAGAGSKLDKALSERMREAGSTLGAMVGNEVRRPKTMRGSVLGSC